MNRRNAALALVTIGAVGGVAADRALVEDDAVDDADPIRDAWTTQEGRAVVTLDPEADVDWIAIESGPHVMIAVEPPPSSDIMSIPLEVQQSVRTEPTNGSRPDVEIPAALVRGEPAETEPMSPGHYQVLAVRDGRQIQSVNITVSSAAVGDSDDEDD